MDISKRLLIHTCTYSTPTTYDRDGNPTQSEAKTLLNVRLGAVLATAKSDIGETKDDKLTLYYAPGVSSPELVPVEGASVVWNGGSYTIRSVKPCYTQGADTVHHYEAALV